VWFGFDPYNPAFSGNRGRGGDHRPSQPDQGGSSFAHVWPAEEFQLRQIWEVSSFKIEIETAGIMEEARAKRH